MAKIVNQKNELTIFFNEGNVVMAIDYTTKFVIAYHSMRWEISAEDLLRIMEEQSIKFPFGITGQ